MSYGCATSSLAWSTCGRAPLDAALLIVGFSDGTARAFRLLCGHRKAAVGGSNSDVDAFTLPNKTHFLHVATFTNPSRHEPVAFVAGRSCTDGSAAVTLLGIMGGRSVFSTAMPSINELQPWHHRHLPQDFSYPSAMLWPNFGRTIIVADCESSSVEEIDCLTGQYAPQLTAAPAVFYSPLCFSFFTGHPRQTIFTLADQQWPMDIAYSHLDFFGAKHERTSLFVAGSDGGIYLAPLHVCATNRSATLRAKWSEILLRSQSLKFEALGTKRNDKRDAIPQATY
jgi:hypothetical protein